MIQPCPSPFLSIFLSTFFILTVITFSCSFSSFNSTVCFICYHLQLIFILMLTHTNPRPLRVFALSFYSYFILNVLFLNHRRDLHHSVLSWEIESQGDGTDVQYLQGLATQFTKIVRNDVDSSYNYQIKQLR